MEVKSEVGQPYRALQSMVKYTPQPASRMSLIDKPLYRSYFSRRYYLMISLACHKIGDFLSSSCRNMIWQEAMIYGYFDR